MDEDAKRAAAIAAVGDLPEAGVIGLGTGSTARHFVEAVARLVRGGRRLVGVCTSEATRAHATALGIPLLPDAGPWAIDVDVDGADEVDDALDLSKGQGGALTREKIVSFAARRMIVVCDATKRVQRLGQRRPISVEILAFGSGETLRHLGALGRPALRAVRGAPARSDAGNLLVDLTVAPVTDAGGLDRALRAIPGVVETGLFIGRADVVLIGSDAGVERLERRAP